MPTNNNASQPFLDLPSALTPIYSMPEPNTPIVLHDGNIELEMDESVSVFHGNISLSWFPRYGINFHIPDAGIPAFPNLGAMSQVKISAPEHGVTAIGHLTKTNFGMDSGGNRYSLSGHLGEVEVPSISGITEVIFHLTNFVDYSGERILCSDNSMMTGRLRLNAGGWDVVMDEIDGAAKKVKSSGGYIFTHVGQVKRSDGSSFSSTDISSVLESLTLLFWFASGKYISPLLAVGLGADGNRLWEDWGTRRQQHWGSSLTWFPENSPQSLSALFPALLGIVQETEQEWYLPVKLAINWFVQSSNADTMESGLILAQVGLELLAWVEIVEKRGLMSRNSFDRKSTTAKLRQYFSLIGIPLPLPTELLALKEVADKVDDTKYKNMWSDGPESIVELRNCITHAKRRNIVYDASMDVRWDALKLARWYLELSILYVLGYEGVYTCRLRKNLFRGQEELVPWANERSVVTVPP